MNKNNFFGVVIVFILIAVIRILGIDKLPLPIVVLILVACMIAAFLSTLKYKGNKKERIYLLAMTILVTLLFSTIIIAIVVESKNPELSVMYKPIFIALMAILFISLLITIFLNIIYKFSKGN